jgi:four helix bundle protein
MENTGFRKLIVYQKAKQLTLLVYRATKDFPKEERYGITSQARPAALSIAANIVEGYVKSSRKEFVRFLDISIGSSAELEVHLDISHELGYLKKDKFDTMADLLVEVKKLLYSYQKSLRA